jgi:hypothetical protein
MNTPLAVLDFFDSRAKAVAIWGAVILTYAAIKGEGVVPSMVRVVRSLLAPKLLLLFGSAAVYCAACVSLARWLGFWHTTAVKETIYWFITGGAVLSGRAVEQAAPFDRAFYLKLIRHAIRFTIVVEFLVNLYVSHSLSSWSRCRSSRSSSVCRWLPRTTIPSRRHGSRLMQC